MATTIKLDRERTLKCDYNALAAFDEKTGLSPYAAETWASQRPSVLRALLWALLRADDPSITIEQVGAMITGDNMAEVFESAVEEFQTYVNPAKKKEPTSKTTSGAFGRGRKSSTASRTKSSGS